MQPGRCRARSRLLLPQLQPFPPSSLPGWETHPRTPGSVQEELSRTAAPRKSRSQDVQAQQEAAVPAPLLAQFLPSFPAKLIPKADLASRIQGVKSVHRDLVAKWLLGAGEDHSGAQPHPVQTPQAPSGDKWHKPSPSLGTWSRAGGTLQHPSPTLCSWEVPTAKGWWEAPLPKPC